MKRVSEASLPVKFDEPVLQVFNHLIERLHLRLPEHHVTRRSRVQVLLKLLVQVEHQHTELFCFGPPHFCADLTAQVLELVDLLLVLGLLLNTGLPAVDHFVLSCPHVLLQARAQLAQLVGYPESLELVIDK